MSQDSPDSSAETAPQAKSGRGLGAVVLHHTVTALMLVLILALGVWAYLTFRKADFFEGPDQESVSRLDHYGTLAQGQRIRFALRVYYRLDGRYPANLQELVDRGLLLQSDLYYPSREEGYGYERTGSGYRLRLGLDE